MDENFGKVIQKSKVLFSPFFCNEECIMKNVQ